MVRGLRFRVKGLGFMVLNKCRGMLHACITIYKKPAICLLKQLRTLWNELCSSLDPKGSGIIRLRLSGLQEGGRGLGFKV